jgi:regulator of cell morphogenesis and NO signaling
VPVDFATCNLAELIQHIRDTHHTYLRAELPGIWDSLREARDAGGSAATDVRRFGHLFGLFRSTLDSHLRKEEEVLFPFIERLERSAGVGGTIPTHRFGPLARPIEILEGEHALGDALLDRMRPLWQAWGHLDEPCVSTRHVYERMRRLEADMQRHVHLEDAMLFPRTIQLEAGPWPVATALR